MRAKKYPPGALLALLLFAPCGVSDAMPPAGSPDKPHGSFGAPLVDRSLPDRVVTVKVVGKGMSDVRVGAGVELFVLEQGKAPRSVAKVQTGKDGRARFSGVPAGSSLYAQLVASVTRSEPFRLPPKGGVRLLLSVAASEAVSGGKAAVGKTGVIKKPAASSRPASGGAASKPTATKATRLGTSQDTSKLRLAADSHILAAFTEDHLDCMQVLVIENPSTDTIVEPGKGLRFALPDSAVHPSVSADMKRWLSLSKDKRSFVLRKLLMPGRTTVRLLYKLPLDGDLLDFRQSLPMAAGPSQFAIQNGPQVSVFGPQLVRRELRRAGQGKIPVFIFKPVPAGGLLEFTVSGVPHRDHLLRNGSLAVAVLLLLWALVGGMGRRARSASDNAKREELLAQLVDLERSGGDEKKRQKLYAKLREVWR